MRFAGVVSIIAGIYMATSQAQASDSIFNVFLRGIGAYLIARGIYMFASAFKKEAALKALERLVELNTPPPPEPWDHPETPDLVSHQVELKSESARLA